MSWGFLTVILIYNSPLENTINDLKIEMFVFMLLIKIFWLSFNRKLKENHGTWVFFKNKYIKIPQGTSKTLTVVYRSKVDSPEGSYL